MQEIDEETFQADPQKWQQEAQREPVIVMSGGLPVLYLLSKPVFDSLYTGTRRAVSLSELEADEKQALLAAEMSAEHDHLDALLEDDAPEGKP
jgi:hypothetical protein